MTEVLETTLTVTYPMNDDVQNTWEAAVLARSDVNADIDPTLDHTVETTNVMPDTGAVTMLVSVNDDVTPAMFTNGEAIIENKLHRDKI